MNGAFTSSNLINCFERWKQWCSVSCVRSSWWGSDRLSCCKISVSEIFQILNRALLRFDCLRSEIHDDGITENSGTIIVAIQLALQLQLHPLKFESQKNCQLSNDFLSQSSKWIYNDLRSSYFLREILGNFPRLKTWSIGRSEIAQIPKWYALQKIENRFFFFQILVGGFLWRFLFQISVFLTEKNKRRHSKPKFWVFKNKIRRLKNISDQNSVDPIELKLNK